MNGILEGDQDPAGGFRAELVPSSRKINAERRAKSEAQVRIHTRFVQLSQVSLDLQSCLIELTNLIYWSKSNPSVRNA